jgi:hypothetical protein
MGEGIGEDGRSERGLRRPKGGRTTAAGPRRGHGLGEIDMGENEEILTPTAL